MYTLSDKSQFQAYEIKQGNHKLTSDEQGIMDWISKQFSVRALNFYRETRTTSKGLTQQLVHVIMDTIEDANKMQANRAAINETAERFSKHLDAHEILVTFRPLKALSSETLREMLVDERNTIFKMYECVWTISQSVVFYNTDAQVKENMTNGTSEKIVEELRRVGVKFGFSGDANYSFDSKESFDRDYGGQWHYYWK